LSRPESFPVALPAGATLRLSRPVDELAGELIVLGLGGSAMRTAPPRWSASVTWLLGRLARDAPAFTYAELRYRDRNWRALAESMHDAREALAALPSSSPIALVGFSMGGGIAIGVAGDGRVQGVVGLAPWVPDQIPLGALRGKRLAIVHGSRDRSLPFLPGVHPAHSQRLLQRAAAAGARTSLTTIEGAIHGIAIGTPFGLLALPHAAEWKDAVAERLAEMEAEERQDRRIGA
jgi:dienelactone hydrolase